MLLGILIWLSFWYTTCIIAAILNYEWPWHAWAAWGGLIIPALLLWYGPITICQCILVLCKGISKALQYLFRTFKQAVKEAFG